jgi:cytoskeleton protein RodZ
LYGSAVSLFQRIKTPFTEIADDGPAAPRSRPFAIGELLRDRREELDLDLGAVGEALRIKPIYLAALEQGRVEDLPGPAYAIGFTRAYAEYLGFDAERVLERYKAETAEAHARPDLSLPVPLGARSLPGGPILLVGLILALCGYGTWYYLSTGERSRPERVAAIPAELRQLPGADPAAAAAGQRFGSGLGALPEAKEPSSPAPPAIPSSGLVGSPAAAAPPPPAPPISPQGSNGAAAAAPAALPAAVRGDAAAPSGGAAADPGAGRIDIRALADCWIQVRSADQAIVFSRVLKAGETYHVPHSGLFLRTGNAGALAVAVDGKPAPAIGGIGALLRNVALDPEALLAGTAVHG